MTQTSMSTDQALNLCHACPSMCQSVCPVTTQTGDKAHSPWGLMQTLRLKRLGEFDRDSEHDHLEQTRLPYFCTGCHACTELCLHQVPVAEVLRSEREHLFKSNTAPSEIRDFVEMFQHFNNPYELDLRKNLTALVPEARLNKTPLTYFASCTTIAKTPDVVTHTMSVLEKLGIKTFSVYPDPIQCCGYPLWSAGTMHEFYDLAEVNYHTLCQYDTIIVGSPTCTYMLRHVYQSFDLDLSQKIVSLNEFIAPRLKNTLKKSSSARKTTKPFMYHDPCYQSRYLDESKLVRSILNDIGQADQLTEFQQSERQTQCSGQSGCFGLINRDIANTITKERLAECKEHKIKQVVTQCSTCVHKFRQSEKSLTVKDLITLVDESI